MIGKEEREKEREVAAERAAVYWKILKEAVSDVSLPKRDIVQRIKVYGDRHKFYRDSTVLFDVIERFDAGEDKQKIARIVQEYEDYAWLFDTAEKVAKLEAKIERIKSLVDYIKAGDPIKMDLEILLKDD